MDKMTVGSITQLTTTPGPWEYVPKLTASENHKGFFVRAEKATKNGKWALAEVQPGDDNGKLGEANARLIAAAPALLAALQAQESIDTGMGRFHAPEEVREMRRAALELALGAG